MRVHTTKASSYRGCSVLVKLQLRFQTTLTDFSGPYARELIVLYSCKELKHTEKITCSPFSSRGEFGETEGLGKIS